MSEKGRLYGIGVGPGDPDLLTLKAVRIIREAPVIFVPKGDTGEKSRALSIISPFLRDGHELREITLPMTREPGALRRAWEEAAGEVIAVLDKGKDAVFVTLGDSTLYSTYYYLYEALRSRRPDLAVETVPGVSSFSAGAAVLNRALAVGRESLAIVPASRGMDFIRRVLAAFDCVVLLKVAPVLGEVINLLEELGRLEEAAYVCRCGMPGQFLKENLAGPGELPGDYFSLILVRGKRLLP
ncbi:MAG TPA: precorrin-2 C(20)-methyltransferase [Syntrophomonadaceae bacterium]|nr:precorrin-2 C(20)-methyltransferase [Syntrophomonadaceae bacterium]